MKRFANLWPCVVVFAALLALASFSYAAYSDLQVAVFGINGAVVTVSVHNPTAETAQARVRLTATLDTGLKELLTSSGVSVGPGDTVHVDIQASTVVSSISDDVGPIPN